MQKFMCDNCVKYLYASRVVCAYARFFVMDQGVRLLEHVH